VQGEGASAQLSEVHRGPERAADEPLDLLGPAALLAPRCLPGRPGVGAPREHAVLRGDPAAGLAQEVRWHPVLDRAGHPHPGVADANLGGTLGVTGLSGGDGAWAEMERASVAGAA